MAIFVPALCLLFLVGVMLFLTVASECKGLYPVLRNKWGVAVPNGNGWLVVEEFATKEAAEYAAFLILGAKVVPCPRFE